MPPWVKFSQSGSLLVTAALEIFCERASPIRGEGTRRWFLLWDFRWFIHLLIRHRLGCLIGISSFDMSKTECIISPKSISGPVFPISMNGTQLHKPKFSITLDFLFSVPLQPCHQQFLLTLQPKSVRSSPSHATTLIWASVTSLLRLLPPPPKWLPWCPFCLSKTHSFKNKIQSHHSPA